MGTAGRTSAEWEVRVGTSEAALSVASRPVWRIDAVRLLTAAGADTVTLRPISTGDADLMAEFFAALTAREIFYFFALDATHARHLALDAETDPAFRLIAVGDHEGHSRVLGYMFLDWRDGDPPTYGACLREGAQSIGLGRAMIDHLLQSAAESGVGPIHLTVHADNWRALRLYQRAGFRIHDEIILESQGTKQYRMATDLRAPRHALTDALALIARGGIGVGMAAVAVQRSIEVASGQCPLIVDRPIYPGVRAIIVADLASGAERPFDLPSSPALQGGHGPAWIDSLDERHLLIAGIGPAAVARAARAYADLVDLAGLAGDLDHLPFTGLHRVC